MLFTLLVNSSATIAGPLEDATQLVFAWLPQPAAEGERGEFERDVAAVLKAGREHLSAARKVELAEDRMAWYRSKVDAGELEQDKLWKHAEALHDARLAAEESAAEYHHLRESVARRWAGDQAWLLSDLLAETVSSPTP